MENGKLPSKLLESLILNKLDIRNSDVLLGPKIGEDCSVIDFGDYAAIVSTDPITGALSNIGHLAVNVSSNDIATMGIRPMGVLFTLMLPLNTTENIISEIINQINESCKRLNIVVLGGHTEITDTVKQPVIVATTIAKAKKGEFILNKTCGEGDDVILTKVVAAEGTSILYTDFEDKLKGLIEEETIEKGKSWINHLSVIEEGVIAYKGGATAMHDVTEGGVLGAAYEMATAGDMGIELYYEKMPIAEETKIICDLFDIDPLKLISSGAMMIVTKNGQKTVENLQKSGIKGTIIGRILPKKEGKYLLRNNKKEYIEDISKDELYKALKEGIKNR